MDCYRDSLYIYVCVCVCVISAGKPELAKQLPNHWVLEALSSGMKQPLLAIQFYLILTLRMHGSLPPFLLKASCRDA
jgi:hypothetical protein